MEPETVKAVLEASKEDWTWSNNIEITLEANPRSVDAVRFEGYANAGVNRVSLGVQSLRDPDLKALGRLHGVEEAKAAFSVARSVFDRVSFDLIYARQGQSLEDWRDELHEALDLSVDHLSLYQLTIEQGTAFGDRYNTGRLKGLPDDDLGADMFELTQEICAEAGMPAYEVSNHAAPGAESRHNQIYWRYGDYAGVGPGAHGRLTLNGKKFASVSYSQPGKWLASAQGGSGDVSFERLSGKDQAGEYLMMGLRLREGVSLDRLRSFNSRVLADDVVEHLVDLGLAWKTENALGVTEQGKLVLNAVIAELLP